MSNAGNPNADEVVQPEVGRGAPWSLLIIAVVGVLLALYVGTQVIGVLIALADPPDPPLPEGTTRVSHTNAAHGDDSWVYSTQLDVCDAAAFYAEQGGGEQCTACANQETVTCSGLSDFSIFTMRWTALIEMSGGETQINLSRQVSWSGYFPTPTP